MKKKYKMPLMKMSECCFPLTRWRYFWSFSLAEYLECSTACKPVRCRLIQTSPSHHNIDHLIPSKIFTKKCKTNVCVIQKH